MSSSSAASLSPALYSQKQVCHFIENCLKNDGCFHTSNQEKGGGGGSEGSETEILAMVYSPIDLLWENALVLHEEQTAGASTCTHTCTHDVFTNLNRRSDTRTHNTRLIVCRPHPEMPQHKRSTVQFTHGFKSTWGPLHENANAPPVL